MRAMIEQAQIRQLLTLIGGLEPGEPIKGVHAAAAEALGWTEGAVWNLWYGRGSVRQFIKRIKQKNEHLLAAERARAERRAAELEALFAELMGQVGGERECGDGSGQSGTGSTNGGRANI